LTAGLYNLPAYHPDEDYVPILKADVNHHLFKNVFLFAVLSLFVESSIAQTARQLMNQQMTLYRATYPEIEFKLLHSMADFDELMPLTNSLGKDLSNVDYEQPDDLRKSLVEAQEYRIAFQLNNGNGTATLFKTPNARITKKPYTCLLTLNLALLDETALAASRFLYDVGDVELNSIPEPYLIDNHDFLVYSIDHEVFHCIDAYTSGFIYPRTLDPVKVSLNHTRAELRTEMFAAMAHLSRQPKAKRFLRNLAIARTVNLLNGDLEHFTSDALNLLVDSSKQNIPYDINSVAEKSMSFTRELIPSYEDHMELIVTLRTVLEEFEIDADFLFTEYPELALNVPLREEVELLRRKITNALTMINPQ
jgi:hypothetical protein